MAFITADRVLDSSTSTGTGAFVVSGTPASGYRTFSTVMSVGDTCYYSIQGQTTAEFEVGLGTYSSANTLTRTTVYSSSNANAAVSFSAGTKNVFITMAASKSPQLDPSGNVTALGTPASATLTNATGLSLTTGVTGVLPSANGGSLAWQSVQTGNFTAVAGNAYPVNTTSGAVTVTLPASPTAGQQIIFTDYAGKFSTNACILSRNGSNINGNALNSTLTGKRESVSIVYIDATQGWVAYSGFLTSPLGIDASYLVVAGGAGGGKSRGGGGGAGGLLTGLTTLIPNTVYTITVGAGGAGATTNNVVGTSGSNSIFGSISIATGGGGGAGTISTFGSVLNGASGGSGGGASGNPPSPGAGGVGGSGTSGQGFAGGKTYSDNVNYTSSGGGGGASAVGADAGVKQCGAGGAGTSSSITGSAVTYAGGGGGGGDGAPSGNLAGAGGSGGGGAGSVSGTAASDASANTGGGGGGGGNGTSNGGSGGSGVVILSVPTASYSGTTTGSPTVTTSGSNTIIKFTASGSYTA